MARPTIMRGEGSMERVRVFAMRRSVAYLRLRMARDESKEERIVREATAKLEAAKAAARK